MTKQNVLICFCDVFVAITSDWIELNYSVLVNLIMNNAAKITLWSIKKTFGGLWSFNCEFSQYLSLHIDSMKTSNIALQSTIFALFFTFKRVRIIQLWTFRTPVLTSSLAQCNVVKWWNNSLRWNMSSSCLALRGFWASN